MSKEKKFVLSDYPVVNYLAKLWRVLELIKEFLEQKQFKNIFKRGRNNIFFW